MKYRLAIFLALAVAGSVAAADKPNFSGEWKMNPSKSNYGLIPAPNALLRKITHIEPSITIAEDQTAGAMELVPNRKFSTDGQAGIQGSKRRSESAALLPTRRLTPVAIE